MLELDGDFFGRKMECVGAGISGGEPPWAHEAGAQGGRARPPPSWAHGEPPWCVLSAKILKYSTKNHIKFSGHLENFSFRGIFLLQG